MQYPVAFWLGFHILIAILLVVDLGLLHRRNAVIKFKAACLLSGFWIALALLFNVFIYFYFGSESALQFFTGYLIEKSLSVDNLFVFLTIFTYFSTPPSHQYKILFWGILGALVCRISLILLGVNLIAHFHFLYYLFGVFLVVSAIKLLRAQASPKDPSQGMLFKTLRRFLPMARGETQGHFFVKRGGKWKATSLVLTLAVIECTDLIFALDSVPAIFAVTSDPFIIYTSNIFAILGLRSLHFVLGPSLQKLHYFKFGLAAILVFVGGKMLLADLVSISLPVCLGVIFAILIATVLASLQFCRKRRRL